MAEKPKTAKSNPRKMRGRSSRPTPAAAPAIPYARHEIEEIFHRFRLQRPEPRTELDYLNPFTLLVAVVLSAQSTDVGVNKVTKALFPIADTPEKMLLLGEEAIREHLKSVGFYRMKAKNVVNLSQRLVAEHGGAVPHDRAALESLPGVGRKTANVVLNVAFGEKTLAVDTHIFRIGNRLHLAPGATPDEVEAGFLRIIPDAYMRDAHNWLILHGRYTCKARRPECESCVIADLCRAEIKTNAIPAPIVPILHRPQVQEIAADR